MVQSHDRQGHKALILRTAGSQLGERSPVCLLRETVLLIDLCSELEDVWDI